MQARLSPNTQLRAKYDQESNQGNNQQILTPIGNVLEGYTLEGSLDSFQSQTEVNNSLTTISLGVQQKISTATLDFDWIYRQREDQINPNLNSNSQQLRSRLSLPLTDNLTFRALNQLTLSEQTDAVYGDRTAVELDWQFLPGVNLLLGQNWYTKGTLAGSSITSLSLQGDYNFSPNTRLTGRYSLLGGENDWTGHGAIGLQHDWQLTPGLKLNLAYERIFGNFGSNVIGTGINQQSLTTGSNSSVLGVTEGNSYSVGLDYASDPNFQFSANWQHRSSSQGSNTVISASALGKITPSLSALLDFHHASSTSPALSGLGSSTDLKLGLAFRDPHSDEFNALLKYEYRRNPATIPDTILFGSGTGSQEHLFSAEAIYAPNWQWEFYGKYAFRTSTTYLANDFVANSIVSLAQLRATYRLGYSWDLVGEARWITQPTAGYSETGFLLETGYYLTSNLRLAAGYSLGDISDRDFSGSRSAGGPYVNLTLKFDDLFFGN